MANANANQPIYNPPMEPPNDYPPREAPKEKGIYWNYGSKDHYLPNCPYPNQEEGYVALCENCKKEEHLPPKCHEPYKLKMLVRYAQKPTPKPKTKLVCLVYADTNNSKICGTVILVEKNQVISKEGVFNIRHVPNVYVKSKVYKIEVPNLVKEEVIGKQHKQI
jgi:hypothetical protein